MTYIPTQSGFMNLEDSQKLLRAIFPNYPSLDPCRRPPSLEPMIEAAQMGEISHVLHHC
jgi:hypothetical protein